MTVQDRFIVYSSLMTSAERIDCVDQRQECRGWLRSNLVQPGPTGQNLSRVFRLRVTVGSRETLACSRPAASDVALVGHRLVMEVWNDIS
jgi:hypothetical protein